MDIIVQISAVFTLLLYKYVCYSCRSIVEIHHLVYRYFYRYFARNSVFFIGMLSVFKEKFGLGNIFETPLAALAGLPAVSAIPFFFARKGVKLILFGIFLLVLLSSKITSFGLKPVIEELKLQENYFTT